ncbi:MAG: alpha-amylase family glycosyl hydrolase [Candidatus Cloacimonadales bacterium]|nr:alpha-amylase family glycosyl hydrolase [Candidatus Cloacimonadales bacterium]
MRRLLIIFFCLFSISLRSLTSLQEYISDKASHTNFKQIPHSDFFDHESIIVWGASSEDSDELDVNEMIANNVVDFRLKRWLNQPDNVVEILEDSEVTMEQLEKYNLILVGTPGSNSVLNALSKYLPVEITDAYISFADQKFEGDEVGIMYRYPNPANPNRLLWIVSAPNYEALRFIPQTQDYCVYALTDYNPMADRFLELALGNFAENWQVKKVAMVDNQVVDSGENDILEYEPPASFPPPDWIRDGVMYEIFVRSFADSDADGIGDLQGIINKLDYLNDGDPQTDSDLGIKLIWLMPIFASPSYHGYDVRDYYKINPDYGTNADFQQLLQQAHRRGIRIITDLALNHCSNQNAFYLDAYNNPHSQYDDWFFFTNPSNTRAHNWQFRHRPSDREMLNPPMPAWNVNNPAVQNYLFETAKYWIDPNKDGDFSDGIDGFRCDYVKGPPASFWQKFRYEVKSLNPEVLLLAENWDGMQSISESFNDQFDMAFDFPFQGSVMEVISSGTASPLINLMNEQQEILPEDAVMNRFINNHDMNRIFTRLDDASAKLALALLLTIPDMPMLYYGDEIGMQGQKDPYDEGIRRPMEWCAENKCPEMTSWYPVWKEEVDGISVLEENDDPNSILNYTKKLIRLRDQYPVLESGKIIILPVFEEIEGELGGSRRSLCYLIKNNDDTILAISSLREDRTVFIENIFPENVTFEPLLNSPEINFYKKYLKIDCIEKTMFLFFVRIRK